MSTRCRNAIHIGMKTGEHAIVELRELRNRVKVFRDRKHAGEVLAGMLAEYRGTDTRVLGILAGGVPVAAAISRALELPLDVAVVNKITLPWNSEMGYGAVAFDGTVQLNDALIQNLGLGPRDVEAGIARTREKVNSRLRRFRAEPAAALAGHAVILVDDGLASGFTLLTAIAAVQHAQPARLWVAVPTGHGDSAQRIAAEVDALYCANVRTTHGFAVADAYEHWSDVSEDDALAAARRAAPGRHGALAHDPSRPLGALCARGRHGRARDRPDEGRGVRAGGAGADRRDRRSGRRCAEGSGDDRVSGAG